MVETDTLSEELNTEYNYYLLLLLYFNQLLAVNCGYCSLIVKRCENVVFYSAVLHKELIKQFSVLDNEV